MLYCLVDPYGRIRSMVFSDKDADNVCKDEANLIKYGFDLENRRLVPPSDRSDPNSSPHGYSAGRFFAEHLGTPERLVEFARQNGLPKLVMAGLLEYQAREFFLDVCGRLERMITEYCASKVDEHCIEGAGCPFVEEGICTEACNRNDQFYARSCLNMWLELFKYPKNRIGVWKK